MDELSTIYTVGACVFGATAIVTGLIFVYFVRRGLQQQQQQSEQPGVGATRTVHWLSSIWIYMALFSGLLLLTLLYAVNATRNGFFVTPTLHVVNWLRWLMLALVGLIYVGCLAFVLTGGGGEVSASQRPDHHLRGTIGLSAQAFFVVFYYVIAILAIYFAVWQHTNDGKIVLASASILFYVLSILLLFFPQNRFHLPSDGNDYVFFSGGGGGEAQPAIALRWRIISCYRIMMLCLISLSYVINIIIWFLSRSNGISDALSLRSEAIAYLVSDFLFIVVFTLAFILMTFYYQMKTLQVRTTNTDAEGMKRTTITYKSNQTQQLNGIYRAPLGSSIYR